MPEMQERWLPVPGWPAYEVSDWGRVRSIPRTLTDGRPHAGCMLKQSPDSNGYLAVQLSAGRSRRRTVMVHILVMEAFAGPCPPGMEICHGPYGKTDNRLSNLRYGTHSQNELDKRRTWSSWQQLGQTETGLIWDEGSRVRDTVQQAPLSPAQTSVSSQRATDMATGRETSPVTARPGIRWLSRWLSGRRS